MKIATHPPVAACRGQPTAKGFHSWLQMKLACIPVHLGMKLVTPFKEAVSESKGYREKRAPGQAIHDHYMLTELGEPAPDLTLKG